MSAALMGLSKKAAEALLLGEFKETYIKSKKGTIHLYAITSVGVLAVLSRHDANIGMINLESRLAVRKIADILGG